MAHVVGAARLPGKLQVPLDLQVFALRGDPPVAVGGGVGSIMDVPAPQKVVYLAVGG